MGMMFLKRRFLVKIIMWQKELKQIIVDSQALARMLGVSPVGKVSERTLKKFPLRVPRCLVRRIQKNNLNDPWLKQVLPSPQEESAQVGFIADPLAEAEYTIVPGVLHKYYGRVLLLVTQQCVLNCRFCFRRGGSNERIDWQAALRYIASDQTITEVILSGGDPLMLDDAALSQRIKNIAAIKHVRYLRIHTRLPLIIPQRVTKSLLQALTQTRLIPVMVIHCNHAQEISEEVRAALGKLKKDGVTLLNQTVLLREINDQPKILIELSHTLFVAGVLPYYLHILDKVAGAQHFYVESAKAKKIYREIVTQLPGYLVPRLVMEVIGATAKQQLKIRNGCHTNF